MTPEVGDVVAYKVKDFWYISQYYDYLVDAAHPTEIIVLEKRYLIERGLLNTIL